LREYLLLRFPRGEEARSYNVLQKLAYFGLIGIVIPVLILAGLNMSPGLNAAFRWLVDLFGGRQSARTIHFLAGSALLVFILVHVAMVLLSGVWNNMRSMITGRYRIQETAKPHLPIAGSSCAGWDCRALDCGQWMRSAVEAAWFRDLIGTGETLTRISQRAVLSDQALARSLRGGSFPRIQGERHDLAR
jgi:hypothetical protein